MGFILDESGREVTTARMVAGCISSLVIFRGLQLDCSRLLHEILIVPVLMYGGEAMICKEKDRSRIKTIQMDNLTGLLKSRMY